MLQESRALANHHAGGEDNGCAVQLQQVGQDRVPPGPDYGGFGGSDGARAAGAQRGGAVSGEAVAGQAGRAPDPPFSEAAGADASAAGGAGPPGAQRRHGAAGRSGVAAGHRRPGGHGSAGQGRAPALAADAVAAGGCVVGEGGRRGAARGVAAAGGLAAEGDGRVAASEDAGHRHRQPAGRGSRGTAGQRVERLLSPARVSSDRGVGGGDGRHPGPAAARGAGPHGGRRAGVCPRGAGAGGAASVREGRGALRRGISRRAADGGAGGAGHALCGPGAWATPC